MMLWTYLRRTLWLAALAWIVAAVAPAQAADDWKSIEGEAFTFTEVRAGVWHVVGNGSVAAGSNGAVIVNDDDVLVVDSHMTPAAGAALLEDLPLVTDKPVRYLVNTHFHFDHVQGNQVFGPGVEIVAHEWTRKHMADGGSRSGRGYEYFIGTLPARIEAEQKSLEESEGKERNEIESGIQQMSTLWEQDQQVRIVAPTLAISNSMTLHRGGREIRIFFSGRGHTGGDVVVYLPAERVLVSGDLIVAGLPYMGDGHLLEWAETLAVVAQLDIDVIVPGHGAAFEGSEPIAHLREYLLDLWRQAAEMHRSGVSASAAAERIDLTAHSEHYPQIKALGASEHAVERVYELLSTR